MFLAGLPLTTLLAAFAVAGALVVASTSEAAAPSGGGCRFSRIWQERPSRQGSDAAVLAAQALVVVALQLLLLLALVFALGRSAHQRGGVEGRNIVVLVDGTALHEGDGPSSPRVCTRPSVSSQKARAQLGGSRSHVDRANGRRAHSAVGHDGELPELERAVAELRATDTRGPAPWARVRAR